MSNTLTGLIPTMSAAMMRVRRNTCGIFNAINLDTLNATPVAHNQTVRVNRVAAMTAVDVTPSATAPALTDRTVPYVDLTVSGYKASRFHLTAEEQLAIAANGPEFRIKQIDAAIAVLLEAAATQAATVAAAAGGLAFGTAGTTPFASNADIIADLAEALDFHKAPLMDRWLVIDSLAKRNFFKLDQFQKLNEAPEGVSWARNAVREIGGMMLTMDQSVASLASKGTENGAYLAAADAAEGATAVTLDTGAGTILEGAVVRFGASPVFGYVVDSFAGGVLTLKTPLREAVANNAAVAVSAGKRNFAAHIDAIAGIIRPPAEVDGGDAADDVVIVTDPETGLGIRVASYAGYHARAYEASIVYGFAAVDDQLLHPLLG